MYVGNLHEAITEVTLAKIFGRFGPLLQVKLMLPRNEAEIARKKLCAFVTFECFSAAYLAKRNLNEKKIFEQNIKIVWSKNLAGVVK